MATRFETKTISVKNLSVEEVKKQINYFYNSLPAVYKEGEEDQFKLSRSGSDKILVEFARPIVLVPGICSISRLTVNIKELGGDKQTYVICQDFPGIKEIHLWTQYLPQDEGTIMRMVCELDFARYNPVGRVIQNLVEKHRDIIEKDIPKVSKQIEEELNKLFAPEKEEVAENA